MTGHMITPTSGRNEIKITPTTTIQVCKKLNFAMKDCQQASPLKLLSDLQYPNKMCSVKVKMVGFVDQKHEVSTAFGMRDLQTAALSDSTSIIKMPLWGENIEKLEKGKSYELTNVLNKQYRGHIQLNTTTDTNITVIDDLHDVREDVGSLFLFEIVEGKIQFCQVQTQRKCLQCAEPIDINDIQNVSLVRCSNCKTKQRVPDLQVRRCMKFKIEGKDLIMFEEQLNNYLDKRSLQQLSDDELEDHFLETERIKVQLDLDRVINIEHVE